MTKRSHSSFRLGLIGFAVLCFAGSGVFHSTAAPARPFWCTEQYGNHYWDGQCSVDEAQYYCEDAEGIRYCSTYERACYGEFQYIYEASSTCQ